MVEAALNDPGMEEQILDEYSDSMSEAVLDLDSQPSDYRPYGVQSKSCTSVPVGRPRSEKNSRT